MAINFDKSLTAVLASETVIPANTYGALVAHVVATVDRGETVTGGLAYTVRLRGVAGVEVAQTMTRLARDLTTAADIAAAAGDQDKAVERKRSSLAQWATAYGYLVDTETPVTGDTYRDARRIYNGGKSSRERFETLKSSVIGTELKDRAGAFHTVADECAALKGKKSEPVNSPNGESENEPADSGSETREPRMSSDDIGERTSAWMNALRALARDAGTADESAIALTSALASEAEDLLALIATFVTVGANA